MRCILLPLVILGVLINSHVKMDILLVRRFYGTVLPNGGNKWQNGSGQNKLPVSLTIIT